MTTICIREAMHWGTALPQAQMEHLRGGERTSERHPLPNQRKAFRENTEIAWNKEEERVS